MQVRSFIEDETLESDAVSLSPPLLAVGWQSVTEEESSPPNPPAPGYSGVADHSKPIHSFIEHLMFFVFPFLSVAVFYQSMARLYELELLWLVAIAVPVSFVLGDFVTGIVHWAADTYGSDETPVIGHSFIRPFRLHHLYPKDICTHSVITTLGNSCIGGVPLLSLCLLVLSGEEVSWWLALAIFATAVIAVVTVATNQFHKWAHQDDPKRFVRWLQRARIVLSPTNHQSHHTEPFDKYYCITTGWLNPLLQKLKFFRGLEAMLRSVGIRPAGKKT